MTYNEISTDSDLTILCVFFLHFFECLLCQKNANVIKKSSSSEEAKENDFTKMFGNCLLVFSGKNYLELIFNRSNVLGKVVVNMIL
jgi:hypothetical protein